jgi:hypothetical protein
VQQVIRLGKKATNLQYEEALQAAREALFLQKESNLALAEENLDLQQQLKAIEQKEDLSKYVKFYEGSYWLIKDDNPDGPNCTACWVDRNKLVRLNRMNMGSVWMLCPSCKAQYGHSVKEKYNTEQ